MVPTHVPLSSPERSQVSHWHTWPTVYGETARMEEFTPCTAIPLNSCGTLSQSDQALQSKLKQLLLAFFSSSTGVSLRRSPMRDITNVNCLRRQVEFVQRTVTNVPKASIASLNGINGLSGSVHAGRNRLTSGSSVDAYYLLDSKYSYYSFQVELYDYYRMTVI